MIRFGIVHECKLYGTVGDDTIYIGLVPFETDDAWDPCASFIVPLGFIVGRVSGRAKGDDVLERLEDPAVDSEVVATIVSLVTAFLVRRGARVDRASAIAIVEKDLATAAAEYRRELRGRVPGWGVGPTTLADILLPRETAERWAQGSEELSSELPRDQLVDPIPQEVVSQPTGSMRRFDPAGPSGPPVPSDGTTGGRWAMATWVYGAVEPTWNPGTSQFVVLPRPVAEQQAHWIEVLSSATWGEVRAAASEEEYQELLERAGYGSFEGFAEHLLVGRPIPGAASDARVAYSARQGRPLPAEDDEFDPREEIAAYADGDFPPSPQFLMHQLLPTEVTRRFGHVYETTFNGTYVEFPVESAAGIVDELRRRGFDLEEDIDLVAEVMEELP